MIVRFSFMVGVTGLLVWLTANSFAQVTEGKRQPAERLSLDVQVLDPDGNPIEGALVIPSGMIFADSPLGTFGWIDSEPEKVANLLTDKNGSVTVTYPNHPIENQDVSRIVLKVKHTAFVELDSFVGVADGPVKIGMDRGFRIAASAIDAETGQPIKENLFASTNRIEPADWEQKSNGMLVSPTFGDQECDFRLIEIVDGKPIRFSNVISVDPDSKSRALFKNLKLFKAVTVRGKLDVKVQRPIKNGMISACVATLGDENGSESNAAWYWLNFSEIAADGTFVLDGIPSDSVLQVVAMCDGWSNVPLTKVEMEVTFPSYVNRWNNGMFALPQLVAVGKGPLDVEIEMQKMGRCIVNVFDGDGNPVVGADVGFNPNTFFFHTGFTSGFESGRSSAVQLTQIRKAGSDQKKNDLNAYFRTNFKYDAITDAAGNAVIEQLPATMQFGYVRHPDYLETMSPIPENQLRLQIKPGETAKSTVTLTKPKKSAESTSEPKALALGPAAHLVFGLEIN